ncbi:jeltraxin-like [Leptodactylus fuscus]|uniref:jeltraxin-like n=1 Tax=Leptodactylus fuscus TaxID=238119 RepID=UPI003F4ED4DF
MKEKLFDFPVQSNTSYVRIFPDRTGPFGQVTVCMRFRSNLTREYSLFSLSTRSKDNAFLLFYYPGVRNQFSLSVNNEDQYFDLQGNNFTQWTSICATWDSSIWGLFVDGKYYKVNKIWNVKIRGDPIIILGQEQDSHGGDFRDPQSFLGEMTDVNMWDKALADENMMDYFADNEMNGNVINWKALNYTLHGEVTIKPYVDPYPCVQV